MNIKFAFLTLMGLLALHVESRPVFPQETLSRGQKEQSSYYPVPIFPKPYHDLDNRLFSELCVPFDKVSKQPLSFPHKLGMSWKEMEWMLLHLDEVNELGLYISQHHPNYQGRFNGCIGVFQKAMPAFPAFYLMHWKGHKKEDAMIKELKEVTSMIRSALRAMQNRKFRASYPDSLSSRIKTLLEDTHNGPFNVDPSSKFPHVGMKYIDTTFEPWWILKVKGPMIGYLLATRLGQVHGTLWGSEERLVKSLSEASSRLLTNMIKSNKVRGDLRESFVFKRFLTTMRTIISYKGQGPLDIPDETNRGTYKSSKKKYDDQAYQYYSLIHDLEQDESPEGIVFKSMMSPVIYRFQTDFGKVSYEIHRFTDGLKEHLDSGKFKVPHSLYGASQRNELSTPDQLSRRGSTGRVRETYGSNRNNSSAFRVRRVVSPDGRKRRSSRSLDAPPRVRAAQDISGSFSSLSLSTPVNGPISNSPLTSSPNSYSPNSPLSPSSSRDSSSPVKDLMSVKFLTT